MPNEPSTVSIPVLRAASDSEMGTSFSSPAAMIVVIPFAVMYPHERPMVPPPTPPSRMPAWPKGSMALAPFMNTSSGPISARTFGSSGVFISATSPFRMTWWLYLPSGSVRQQPLAVTTPAVNMPLSGISFPRSSSRT